MKKYKKIMLITSAAVLAAGIGFVAAGAALVNFDFKALDRTSYTSKTYECSKEISSVDIHNVTDSMTFKKSKDKNIRIEYTDSDSLSYDIGLEYEDPEKETGKLTLKINQKKSGPWFDSLLGFKFHHDHTFTIYLPEDKYDSIYAESVSGNISNSVRFSTDKDCSFKTVSGDINVKDIVSKTTYCNTTSGDIRLDNCSSGTVGIHSVSGDAELKYVWAEKKLTIETVSGDVDIDKPISGSIRAKTVSGDVKGTVEQPMNYQTHTVSGDVSVPRSKGNYAFDIETVSGDIEIKDE